MFNSKKFNTNKFNQSGPVLITEPGLIYEQKDNPYDAAINRYSQSSNPYGKSTDRYSQKTGIYRKKLRK